MNPNTQINPSFSGQSNPFHFHNGIDSPLIPVENVRNLYFGYVNTGDTAPTPTNLPTGWSTAVDNPASPTWKVTHNLGTLNYAVVVTTYMKDNSNVDVYVVSNQSLNSFILHGWGIASSSNHNNSFSFILIRFRP